MSVSNKSRWEQKKSAFSSDKLCTIHIFKKQQPLNMWTHLKHQPEQENHSNTGNNICMVLDHKLVAQHRWVLVGLFSDPHVDAIRRSFTLRFTQTLFFSSLSVCVCVWLFSPYQMVRSRWALTASCMQRARLLLNGVSLFCWWEDPRREREPQRLTKENLYARERKQLGLSAAS